MAMVIMSKPRDIGVQHEKEIPYIALRRNAEQFAGILHAHSSLHIHPLHLPRLELQKEYPLEAPFSG